MPRQSSLKILKQFKKQEAQLDEHEREKLRNNMISWLLFQNDTVTAENSANHREGIKGLSEEEMILIRKLAENTGMMHRLMEDDDDQD